MSFIQRNKAVFSITADETDVIKKRMLNWSKQFSILLLLDSNNYVSNHSRYECLLGAGVLSGSPVSNDIDQLYDYHTEQEDWLLGHINYDYKNALEPKLSSQHDATVGFPDFFFFRPQVVCYITKDKTSFVVEAIGIGADVVYQQIMNTSADIEGNIPQVQFERRTSKEKYIEIINQLRRHIKEGDCYEINYCNQGYASGIDIDPVAVFHSLSRLSPAPFSAYYRNGDRYMMCASPERYLYKDGATVLSQPIKGTARRGSDEAQDQHIKEQLRNSIKDRAENVMITDLVRNDLARSCVTGSIRVDELFGIYTFPQVHQMISTISGALDKEVPFTDAIRYSFPMGSMTGAPKIKVMELIDRYEDTRRELFAGTVGYISPRGDFDFNVIIRSLFYNAGDKYLSYQAGGAITYDSNAENEWEEMRLKAWALEKIFAR